MRVNQNGRNTNPKKFEELFKEFGLKFVIIVNKAQIVYMRIRALRIGNKKLNDIKHIL